MGGKRTGLRTNGIARLLLIVHLNERSVPIHLEQIAPHHSNFQPIHVGGPFLEAPYKPHNRSLRSPRLLCLPLLPLSKQTPAFPRELAPLLPFCGFPFWKRGPNPLTQDRISVL
ncbi:hypothetical protein AVEN_225248-1 [Araneus ventricosus]|uniref:Uncharacterized protein n=1 Tax=Araneus ventricosus TaxID=182803 RepID=A0A4Y2ANH6_ARAVE|nr:hypothetical protein AVEN_225248-1 [Araneus ventricosus]